MTDDAIRSQLCGLPGFSDVDLASNEAGTLSNGQRSRLLRNLLLELAALAAFGGLLTWGAVTDGFDFGTLIWLVAIGIWAVNWTRRMSSVLGSTVASIDGDAWVERDEKSEKTEYYLHIAGTRLSTTKQVFEKLESGGPYRAYYLPATNLLVNIRRRDGWHATSSVEIDERHRNEPHEAVGERLIRWVGGA